jgi:hypothetical protein
MATSGTITFNMTARELITFSLRKINLVDENEDPPAGMTARAMTELNVMLKEWQKYENLWRMTEGSVTLIASTFSYALSPVPHRVISARYRDANARDIPMDPLTREEYYDMPLKTGAGIPTQYYTDYQRAAVTMYLWQCPASITTETVKYTFQRKFEDISDPANDIDIKQDHFGTVGYNLAARMADDYGRTGEAINRVIARAEQLRNDALDEDREDFIQFVPQMRRA